MGSSMKILFFVLAATSVLSAVSIEVYNDSPYQLHAKIYSAEDKELSDLIVNSGHSIKWQDSYYDAQDYTKGPFYVVFTCPNGDYFGKSGKVSQNGRIHAMGARGPKKCGSHTQPDIHRDYDQLQPHYKN